MRRGLGFSALAAGLLVSACQGQSLLDQANFKAAELSGIRLYGVSIFAGYSTSAFPGSVGPGVAPTPILGATALGADTTYGASASLGWQRHGDRTNLHVMYSASYSGMVRYSDLSGVSQYLSLDANRALSPKWTLGLSAAAQDTTLAQFLYQPTSLGVISQLPLTFDDLAAALAAGQFTNAQAASMLTGSPVMDSPARSLLLGNRVRSYSSQLSVRYAHSARLSFHFGGVAAGGAQIASKDQNGVQQPTYVLPSSVGFNGGVGMSYALSPRTQLGFDVSGNRSFNRYQSSYITTGTASVGRKMGPHWFLRVYGGGSYAEVLQQMYAAPAPMSRQVVGGGSIGFQTYSHTWIATYDRSSVDTFGLTGGTTTTLMASWNWRRPGSAWSLSTNFGQEQIRNTGFASISGWQAGTGLSRRLSSEMAMTAQYVYFTSQGTYLGIPNKFSAHSVRVSMSWSPRGVQR